jgi:hypothetical protein
MVSSGFYGTTFLGRSTEFNEWPIEEAHGIPNCGHRYEPVKIINETKFMISTRNNTLPYLFYFFNEVTTQPFGLLIGLTWTNVA